MNFSTIIGLLLIFTPVCYAEDLPGKPFDYNFDFALLAQVPEKRHSAIVSNTITEFDSTPVISHKRKAYYAALKKIAGEMKNQYYFHDEFPENVFAGIEERATVLVATQYPLSPTTGNSYYAMLHDNYMNQMAEEIILSMAEAIFLAKDRYRAVNPQSPRLDFCNWKKNWDSAAEVENAPIPPVRFSAQSKTQSSDGTR